MVFSLLRIVITTLMKFMNIPITIEGYTFSMWQIFVFGVISTAFAIIAGNIFKGGDE